MRKSILLLMFVFTFIACNSQVEDVNQNDDNSMFKVTEVEVVSVDSISSDQNWPDLKDRVVVGLKSCPVDSVHNQALIGEALTVETSQKTLNKTTNAKGCISWKEEFKFNYLSDETFFSLEGSIQGNENYRGSQSYSIAVNPWSLKTVDLGQGYVTKTQKVYAAKALASSLGKRITVDTAHVTVLGKQFNQYSTDLRFVVSTQPKLTRRNYNGKPKKELLTGGSFTTNYFLLEKNLKTNERKVLATSKIYSSINNEGFIKDEVQFNLDSGINSNAIIELGMSITPSGAPFDLGSNQGIITVKSISGAFSSQLVALPAGMVNSFNTKSVRVEATTEEDFGFVISKVRFARGSQVVENMGRNGADRGIVANITVCLVDSLIKSQIKNYKFNVKLENTKSNEVIWSKARTTDISDGCLLIDPVISYKRNQRSDWDEFKLTVSSTDTLYSDIVKERVVYINPKIKNDDFGMDSKFKTPKKVEIAKPSIEIKKFSYKFLQNKTSSFKLNRDLELKFNRTYNLELYPEVKVNHDYDGDRPYEALLNGEYELSFLVYVPRYKEEINFANVDLQKFHLLTGTKKTVVVENGMISTHIELPLNFKELLLLSNRNIAVMKLSPIGQDELESGVMMSAFMGIKGDSEGKSLLQSGQKFSSLNKAVVDTGIERLSSIGNKITSDSNLGGAFDKYIAQLESQKSMVPVLNFHWQRTPKNFYKIIPTPLQTGIFKTQHDLAYFLKYKSKMTSEEVEDIILETNSVSADTLAKYCDYMYFDPRRKYIYQGMYEKQMQVYYKCKENPHAYINIAQENHVVEITEQPYEVKAVSRKLGMSSATFTGRGKVIQNTKGSRTTNYTGVQSDAHAMLEFTKIPFTFFSAGVGVASGRREDVFTQTVETDQVMELTRDVLSDGVTLPYEKFTLKFAAKVKTCALITSKVYEAKKLKKRNMIQDNEYEILQAASNKRAYVCLDRTRNIETHDDWYFLYRDAPSLVSDIALAKNMKVNVIRGQRNFNQFRIHADEKNNMTALTELQDENLESLFTQYVEEKALKLPFNTKLGVGIPGLLH